MTTCPVCMNEANNDGDCCSVCGYHFQDATEAFEAISIDTEGERAHAADQAPASLRVCYGKQEGLVFPLGERFHRDRPFSAMWRDAQRYDRFARPR